MTWFRKVLFWLNLTVGLTLVLVIALMAATGSIMAFEHPIVPGPGVQILPHPRLAGVQVTDKSKAWPISSLVRAAMGTTEGDARN